MSKVDLEETKGVRMELRFLRDTDRREVDFVVRRDGRPEFAVECKSGERTFAHPLGYFAERAPIPLFFHVPRDDRHSQRGMITVLPFTRFCSDLGMP